MKDLLFFIENLLKDPGSFDTNRHAAEAALQKILDHYADSRQPTLEEMIKRLQNDYPSIESNVELIEKGSTLRTEMIERAFAVDFSIDEVKRYDARITLFENLLDFNTTLNTLINNVSGVRVAPTGKIEKDRTPKVRDEQGTAQRYLSDKGNKNGEN